MKTRYPSETDFIYFGGCVNIRCVCIHVHVEATGQPGLLLLLRRSSPIRLHWLSCKLLQAPCLHSSRNIRPWVPSCLTFFFAWVPGIELRPSWLLSKHFIPAKLSPPSLKGKTQAGLELTIFLPPPLKPLPISVRFHKQQAITQELLAWGSLACGSESLQHTLRCYSCPLCQCALNP